MKTRSKTRNFSSLEKDIPACSDEEYASTLISPDDQAERLANKRRFRKNNDQVKVLIQEFNENPYWSKEFVTDLASKTSLTESQVYKWNWDYRKKIRKSEKLPYDTKLICKETILPSRFDAEIAKLQRLYKLSFTSVPFATPSRFLFSEI